MPLQRYTFRAMSSVNEIQLEAPTVEAGRAAARAASLEVQRLEQKYSRFHADSLLSHINANAGGGPVPIDEETLGLLAFAGAAHRQSGGLFDPTSGVLRRAWKFDVPRVPSAAELAPVLALIGWDKVEVTDETVRLPLPGMELDFGGFAKEYAVDRAAAVLMEHAIESAMVDLAGDVGVLGTQPGGEPWRVAVPHPRMAGTLAASLPVGPGGLATSSDAERFLEVARVRHCHVLNPVTGQSARGLQSVTVHAPNCLVAGSAATIAMLKGASEGLAWLQGQGLEHLVLAEGGGVTNTFC